jgi:hypothetical protein
MSTAPPAPAMLMVIVRLAPPFPAGGCAPSHLAVTKDPQLRGIRTVYVSLFDSLAPHPSSPFPVTPPHPRHLSPLPNAGASLCFSPALLPATLRHPALPLASTSRAQPRHYSRAVYGWLSRPYADTSDRRLESPPQTSVCERPMCTRQNRLSLMATNPHKFFVTSTASYADLIQRCEHLVGYTI